MSHDRGHGGVGDSERTLMTVSSGTGGHQKSQVEVSYS